jgi:predicted anti-sigma-YlaC factor YlaD
MLVDFADGQLLLSDSNEVAEHMTECERCRTLLEGLQKSLDFAGVIWADGLAETENIRIPAPVRATKFHWARYAAIAASILITATASVVWFALTGRTDTEPTVAEIEREITESASAARLLAATDLLSKHSEADAVARRQYQHIAEAYPETAAATQARLRIP